MLLVGVVIGTAAVMANEGDFGTVEAPEWKSGYKWAYDVSGAIDVDIRVPGEPTYTESIDFGPFAVNKEILNSQDFVNEGEPLYVGATTLPIGHILDMGMFALQDGGWEQLAVFPTADRHRDLAPVLAYPDWDCRGGFDCDPTGLHFGKDTPVDYIQFPLEYGDRWSQTVQFDDVLFDEVDDLGQLGGVTEVKMVGEAGKMETITLPVGKTDAVRLDFSYQPIGLQKAVAEMREQAEGFGVKVERLNVQLGLHEIAHYSPEYQAIARDQFVLQGLVDAVIEFDGERYEFFFDLSGYVLSELTGARLTELPDRSLPEILDILAGREPIPDVKGEAVQDAAYRLELTGERSRVNAAKGEIVPFSVALSDALPDGHSLEYIVRDHSGATVQAAPAQEEFSIRFQDPGVFTVTVAALDGDGDLVTRDSHAIYADFVKTVGASCSIDASLFTGDCGDVPVPARAGLKSMVLEARVNQTLPSMFGLDQLRYEMADGSTRYASGDGSGGYRMEFQGDEVFLAAQDGVLEYRPAAGAFDSVSYTVSLIYGAPVDAQHFEHQASTGTMAVMQDWQAMGGLLSPMDRMLEQVVHGEPKTFDGELGTLLF